MRRLATQSRKCRHSCLQRLGLLQFDGDGLGLDGLGRAAGPIDAVRVEQQLLLGRVVEDGHLLRADDHELLLLGGMEPTDEDVAGDAAAEPQAAEGHVDHAGREIALPFGLGGNRLLAQQVQHHGDVVRGEAPEDVLLGADQPHVQAVGVAVEDSPQGPLVDELPQFDHGGVVEQDVPDHEDPRALLGQRDQFLPLLGVQGQRLLHEDVLARREALPDDVVVRGGGGGHGHGVSAGIVEHVGQLVGELGRIAGDAERTEPRGVGVADAPQGAELREDPHQVLAPIAASDHGDTRWSPAISLSGMERRRSAQTPSPWVT